MRLAKALILTLTITACQTVKPYAALTWDTLDESYTRQIEAQPAAIAALVAQGKSAEAVARVESIKTSVMRWNILSISIEAILKGWDSSSVPEGLYVLLQEARQLLKTLPLPVGWPGDRE